MVWAEPLHRHDWVWLRPDDLVGCDAEIFQWCSRGYPLVAARAAAPESTCHAPDSIRLGLSLPGHRRIGFCVLPSAVRRRAPPTPLCEAKASAPDDWRPALDALMDFAAALDLPVAVYGSLAWQHVSGQPYLSSASDIDLLFHPKEWRGLTALLDGLASLERRFSRPRLDGEVIFPTGIAVAWRELAAGSETILVKSLKDATLRDRADLPALFAGSAA